MKSMVGDGAAFVFGAVGLDETSTATRTVAYEGMLVYKILPEPEKYRVSGEREDK